MMGNKLIGYQCLWQAEIILINKDYTFVDLKFC